jgi:Domain of unknown function (DUF222)
MASEPAFPDPERDEDPAGRAGEPAVPGEFPKGWRQLPPSCEDWLTEEEWVAQVSSEEDEEWAASDEEDVNDKPGSGDQAASGGPKPSGSRAAKGGSRAAKGGVRVVKGTRRGPGQPGSTRRIPGGSCGPAGAFGTGQPLDVAPGGSALLGLAEYAAGDDDRFPRASDDELTGIICALDRAEAATSALKHAAVAELIRRRPESDCELTGPAQMPIIWDEFTEQELADALAETRWAAGAMLDLAQTLAVKLPGTRAAFRTGVLRQSKVEIIARAVTGLDPQEARAAEALVLDRAGRLTPGGLRAAIKRAVIEVAPEKATKRREKGEQDARVERWPEVSGNAGLAGRELPPADVLAADQRITWWAKQLKKAGLDGDMDQLRARAFLDIMLSRDSRAGGSGPHSPEAPPTAGVLPAGFVGRVNLTITLATLLGLAERPGELSGIGPIDPALARDLARAAATNPKTTWCVTVTDDQGHATGHGCARPEPTSHTRPAGRPRAEPPGGPDLPGDHNPPGGTGSTPPPGFTFTASGQDGPPGGYGSWRLTTGVPGQRALMIAIDPIALETCDHRFEARGHDPGVKLRHLAQIRHATCTGPTCRRPSAGCDFEHNIPYEAGGRSCLCNGGPKCRYDHRLKQDPRWRVEQITPGTFRWTAPSGRQYTTEPTRYPI